MFRQNDNGRFTVHKYYYLPKGEYDHAELVLDIQLGEGHASFVQPLELKPHVHYAAVEMYGEIAEAMQAQLEADGVPRGEWEKR